MVKLVFCVLEDWFESRELASEPLAEGKVLGNLLDTLLQVVKLKPSPVEVCVNVSVIVTKIYCSSVNQNGK